MTMYVNSPRAARGQAFFAPISNAAMQVLRSAAAALFEKPGTGLERLDDHLLRDIGLSRNDLHNLRQTEQSGDVEVRRIKL